MHESHQPDAIIDLLDTDGLTRQRSAEIYFLFENADPSAVSNQSCPIVERIREFSNAPILPRGRPIDFDGALHIESPMRALVVKDMDEGFYGASLNPPGFLVAFIPNATRMSKDSPPILAYKTCKSMHYFIKC